MFCKVSSKKFCVKITNNENELVLGMFEPWYIFNTMLRLLMLLLLLVYRTCGVSADQYGPASARQLPGERERAVAAVVGDGCAGCEYGGVRAGRLAHRQGAAAPQVCEWPISQYTLNQRYNAIRYKTWWPIRRQYTLNQRYNAIGYKTWWPIRRQYTLNQRYNAIGYKTV